MEINHNRVVLCTGSREWPEPEEDDVDIIGAQLSMLWPDTWVLHGGARGADFLVHEAVHHLPLVEIRVPYLGYKGRAGGFARNGIMRNMMTMFHNEGMECSVMAFHESKTLSRGTAGMLKLCQGTGWPLKEVWPDGRVKESIC